MCKPEDCFECQSVCEFRGKLDQPEFRIAELERTLAERERKIELLNDANTRMRVENENGVDGAAAIAEGAVQRMCELKQRAEAAEAALAAARDDNHITECLALCADKDILLADLAAARAENERLLRSGEAWSTKSILEKLIEAATILLREKDYDGHGWELIDGAVREARQLLSTIVDGPAALRTSAADAGRVERIIRKKIDDLEKSISWHGSLFAQGQLRSQVDLLNGILAAADGSKEGK